MSKHGSPWRHGLGSVVPYLGVGIQLASTMVVYVGLGWLLDEWQGTAPTFLIVGSVVGMVAFFFQVIRLAKVMSGRKKRSDSKGQDQ